ncbi:unnamed protein product [Alopecurus aequalis]
MTSHCQQRNDHDHPVRLLPDDVLADVLRRLAPRWLAVSRCVCKAWHAVVDGHRLLRTDLLPLSLDGIIINFRMHVYSEFFSRPSTPTAHSLRSKFQHLLTTDAWSDVTDHCNGLLLLENDNLDEYVANPATGAAPLPPCPFMCLATRGDYYDKYLVFDPTVSHHYQVFSIPRLRSESRPQVLAKPEWPPSPFIIRVYSSMSQRWEDVSFSREGGPAGAITNFISIWNKPSAVYWRGSLYVHCGTNYIMRISSSDNKFKVIKLPAGAIISGKRVISQLHLGRPEKGVYFASLRDQWLGVWILDESCCHIKWVLKHARNLKPIPPHHAGTQHVHGPWILQNINYRSGVNNEEPKWNYAPPEEKFEWSSDGENSLSDKDMTKVRYPEDIEILGFHPYKEILFFGQSMENGLAYYFNTARVQVLGNLYPTNYHRFYDLPCEEGIVASFPYTPCLMEMCPKNT